MRNIIAIGATAAMIGACAYLPSPTSARAEQRIQDVCENAYPEVQRALALRIDLDQVSEDGVARIELAKQVIDPICRNEVEGSADTLLSQVEAALIQLLQERAVVDRKVKEDASNG